jgi:hypothetical protein
MTTAANNTATLSIAAYRPKPGKAAELDVLTREHVPYLQQQGLATARTPVVAKTTDGTVIEVFEWAPGGIDKAHNHEGVQALWTRYAAACDFVPLKELPEAAQMFANFTPIN